MAPPDDEAPPPFPRALGLVVRAAITFSLATGAADVAAKHAPPGQRAIWFVLAGATTAFCAWYGWGWLSKRARDSRPR